MKKNSQIKYLNTAKLLNKRELKILDDAGLKKVYDFQEIPVIGLVQLSKLGFESAVDVLKVLHPYYKKKLDLKRLQEPYWQSWFFFKFCVNSKRWHKNKLIMWWVRQILAYPPHLHHSKNNKACQGRLPIGSRSFYPLHDLEFLLLW